MSNIIDRRLNNKGKSINNRQKFLKRVESQIKKALPDIISQESIKETTTGGKVRVPIGGIEEPTFHHDPKTGKKQIVRPGNDRFVQGDKIPKPEGDGQGKGKGKGSNSPEVSEDEFTIILTRDEFLRYFFEDLELPNLVKRYIESTESYKYHRAGYVKYGVPSRLNIKSSFKQSLARHLSLKGAYIKKLNLLEAKFSELKNGPEHHKLLTEIETVKRQMKTVPFMDDVDLRYNNFEQVPSPTTSAVMFCIMDVSASMGFHEKDIAKRFFTLLYIFLTKQYSQVDLVFIRHHTEAKEVDENEFFNSKESGGTIVAPSLDLMHQIIRTRYDESQWNIYCCQASDGDVWSGEDALKCCNILKEKILPLIQYMAYIEIKASNSEGELWASYSKLVKNENFSIRNINEVNQIWPVFKALFKRRKQLIER